MHNKNLQCIIRDLSRINGMSSLSRMSAGERKMNFFYLERVQKRKGVLI
jgi:hypothetical protein